MADKNNKVNFYDILKEMDRVDPKSVLAGIDIIEAKQGKKGTVVSMGIGIDAVKDILSGKIIPVLLMMDSAAYEAAIETIEKSLGDNDSSWDGIVEFSMYNPEYLGMTVWDVMSYEVAKFLQGKPVTHWRIEKTSGPLERYGLKDVYELKLKMSVVGGEEYIKREIDNFEVELEAIRQIMKAKLAP